MKINKMIRYFCYSGWIYQTRWITSWKIYSNFTTSNTEKCGKIDDHHANSSFITSQSTSLSSINCLCKIIYSSIFLSIMDFFFRDKFRIRHLVWWVMKHFCPTQRLILIMPFVLFLFSNDLVIHHRIVIFIAK